MLDLVNGSFAGRLLLEVEEVAAIERGQGLPEAEVEFVEER